MIQKIQNGYIFLTTRNGTVKKTKLSEFENIRRNGMIAIKLDPGDELGLEQYLPGQMRVVIVTRDGKAIRFYKSAVRPMGRATTGVRGIAIGKDDQVISMDLITKGDNPLFLTLMENGLGKKTEVKQFPLQNRGGQG